MFLRRLPIYDKVFVRSVSKSSGVVYHDLKNLFESVESNKMTATEAFEKWRQIEYHELENYAKIDGQRTTRTGFPEVIFAEGKTVNQVRNLLLQLRERSQIAMATRVPRDMMNKLQDMEGFKIYNDARIISSMDAACTPKNKGTIAVLAAGTSDLSVAEEAAITAELSNFKVERLYDVGVAGIHRLLRNRHIVDNANVVICVAGMDGALPGVVGGLTDNPVVAVPTSVGYGASFSGVAPLLTMLNACSPGVGVVNIDNGFGAAVLSAKIVLSSQKSDRRIASAISSSSSS